MTLPDSPPVFILCAPRSGTTWLVRALGAHPEVHATELRAFGHYVDVVHDHESAKPRLRITLDAYLDALLDPHTWQPLGPSRDSVRDDLVRDVYRTIQAHALRRTGKRMLVDKFTPYLGTAGEAVRSIRRLFPDAKIILLLRDGRDVAVSGVMHWLTKNVDRMSEHQRRRRAFLVEKVGAPPDRFFTDDEVRQWAAHWREPIDSVEEAAGALERLDVRYEDMVADLGAELRRIYGFLGVAADDSIIRASVETSTFEAMSGGRSRGEDAPGAHVRKGVVGDWRNYFTLADASLFDREAGRTLAAWGYEPDGTWTRTVPARLG